MIVRSWRIKRLATQDASTATYLGDKRLIATLGPRPAWNVVEYADHGFLADDLRSQYVVEELRSNSRTMTSQRQFPPFTLVLLGGLLCLFVDIVASIQLLSILGIPQAHRPLLGTALALVLIMLTWLLQSVLETPQLYRGVKVGIVTAYFLFLCSAASVRIADLSLAGEGTSFADWGGTILLVFAIAGPAWFAERCLRQLVKVYPREATRTLNNHDLNAAENRLQRARSQLATMGGRQRQWDNDFAQLKSLYDSTFEQTVSRSSSPFGKHLSVGDNNG